jgi:A/G-specific adenine glycosylase
MMRYLNRYLYPMLGNFFDFGGGMRGNRSQESRQKRLNSSLEIDLDEKGAARTGDQEKDWDQDWVESVRQQLVAWYEQAQRDLPWRSAVNPYGTLVSEMMLVQTTVAAVVPYFERFLRQFPDPKALADADEADVLKAWEGLGYYRRARQLQAAARMIVDVHGGKIPNDPAAVRALPGVGRYIAGAILSLAFDRPEPILEANSQRVLARLLAWRGDLKASATRARLWEAAERLVPPRGAGIFNQALMELGALLCTPRQPSCLLCPLATICLARRLGLQDELPVIARKPAPLAVSEACAAVVRKGKILIVQRGPDGLWANFWEFPTINLGGADPAGRSFSGPVDLSEGVKRLTGISARIGPRIKTISYAVTKHRVRLLVHVAQGLSGMLKPGRHLSNALWVEPERLVEFPFGSAGRQLAIWIVQNPQRLGMKGPSLRRTPASE